MNHQKLINHRVKIVLRGNGWVHRGQVTGADEYFLTHVDERDQKTRLLSVHELASIEILDELDDEVL